MTDIYIDNDNLITVDALVDSSDSSYINSATVTATLKDRAGTSVTGQSWPLSLSYVAASNGKYQGTLEDDLVLTKGVTYVLHIDADAGSDQLGHWEIDLTAAKRNS